MRKICEAMPENGEGDEPEGDGLLEYCQGDGLVLGLPTYGDDWNGLGLAPSV